MTCGGLIAIGLILHLFTGAVDWSSFAWPLNICILTVYVVVLIMLYVLRKKLYFVRWTMSYNAAVPSLIAVVFLTFLMGMIKQMPSSVSSDGFSIFNSMLSFWPFILVYMENPSEETEDGICLYSCIIRHCPTNKI